MNKSALILGCGPSGLMAAHAIRDYFGYEVNIVSRKRQSKLFGCQYLHDSIPGMDIDSVEVNYTLNGESADYSQKVYGGRVLPSVSPQQFQGFSPAWNIRQAYEQLWDEFEPDIYDADIRNGEVLPMLEHYRADYVFSSIPVPSICQDPQRHDFDFVKCWAIGDAPELGQEVPIPCEPNTIVCDGTKDVSYYRKSNVFGHKTVEWGGHRAKPPIEGVVEFLKPLSTTCDCLLGVHRVGRMGTWTKGVLAHHVYADVVNYVNHQQQLPPPLNEYGVSDTGLNRVAKDVGIVKTSSLGEGF